MGRSRPVDIDIDWNEEDETGLPWTLATRATHPEVAVPGHYVLAGRAQHSQSLRSSIATPLGSCTSDPWLGRSSSTSTSPARQVELTTTCRNDGAGVDGAGHAVK